MKNNFFKPMAAVLLCLSAVAHAQLVPMPAVYSTLDHYDESMKGVTFQLPEGSKINFSGSAQPGFTTSRHGLADAALMFNSNRHYKLNAENERPTVWGMQPPGTVEEFTVAMWVLIENEQRLEDLYIFSAASGSPDLFVRSKEVFVAHAISDHTGSQVKYEQYQSWPVSVDQGNGWYFVALTQSKFVTRVFIGKPDRTFYCQHSVKGATVNAGNNWFLGNPSGTPVNAADDYMAWHRMLTPEQVYNLFICSYDGEPSTACWGSQVKTKASVKETRVASPEATTSNDPGDYMKLYPNPAPHGEVTLEVSLSKASALHVTVHDTQGSLVIEHVTPVLEAGKHTMKIENLIPQCACLQSSGVYIISVKSGTFQDARRVLITQ